MPYLTFVEYQSIGFSDVPEDIFTKLERKACDVLDSITRDFYQHNDLETDVPIRRDKFKKAVAAQVDYFHDMGATSIQGINTPLSVTIGRTQVHTGQTNRVRRAHSVSPDALMYLRGTGLMYRGLE